VGDIGIKLNVDGEKAFNSALRDINSGLKVLSSELKETSSRFYDNNKSVESFTEQNKVLVKQIDAQKKKIEFLKDTLQQASDAYGENDKRTQNWATRLNTAQTELNKMQGQLSGNNKELDKYADITSNTADSVGKLDKEMGALKNELDAVDKKYGKNKDSASALNEKQRVLTDIFDKQSEKVKVLGDALENSKKAFGVGSDETKKFEKALSDAQSELKGTQSELKNVGTAMENTGKSSKTFGDVLKANLTAQAITEGLKKVKDAVKGVGTYVLGAIKSSADFGHEMKTMAEKTGVSSEVLQKFNAAAKVTEVSVEDFARAYAKSIKSMNSVNFDAKNLNAISKAYQSLGVEVRDSSGNLRDAQAVFWETVDALKNMENSTERNAVSMQIFGKSAMELNPIINQGSEGFNDLTKNVATFDDQTIKSLSGLEVSMTKFSGVMDGIKRSIGIAFAPMMKEIADAAADAGGKLRGLFTAIAKGESQEEIDKKFEELRDSIVKLAEKIKEQMPIFIEVGGKIIGALLEGIKTALEPMLPQMVTLGAAIAAAILGWDVLITAATNALSIAITPVITGMFAGLGTALAPVLATLGATIAAGFSAIAPLISLAIAAWPVTILIALAGILTVLAIKFWPQISKWLSETWEKLKDWGKKTWEKIVTWFNDLKENMPEKTKEIIDAVIEWFKKLPGNIWDAIIGAVEKVKEWGKQIYDTISSKFGELEEKMKEIGGNIVKGLWGGINGMIQWVRNKISGFVNNIKNFFTGKSGFDTHSPSLWAKKMIGENIALGIGEGFSSKIPGVLGEINKSIPKSIDYSLSSSPRAGTPDSRNVDVLTLALKKALSGMAFEIDGDKMGQLVISKVERVVFA
jgi:ABC-type transporter Mla subunit MlaD